MCVCVLSSDLLSCWNREKAGDDGRAGEMFLGLTEWTHVLQTVDEHFLLLSNNKQKYLTTLGKLCVEPSTTLLNFSQGGSVNQGALVRGKVSLAKHKNQTGGSQVTSVDTSCSKHLLISLELSTTWWNKVYLFTFKQESKQTFVILGEYCRATVA